MEECSEERKISVWVCREEKLVLGLSKHTTCADVVKVLLEEQQSSRRGLRAQAYCIVEKYGGFERILPNKTKILRLWMAWGEEQKNVKFVLVKSDASLDNHAARSAEARVVHSKQSSCVAKGTSRAIMSCISPEKQRRIVRKAFRKLEKINKKRTRAAHRDASCAAERMETLVHVVISQDHTIRQQIQRISELDTEIESREAKVHFDRIKRHGVNYVQNTYLEAPGVSNQEGGEKPPSETLAKFEVFVQRCEEVLRLQEELWEQEALIETITAHIQEELNQRWMWRRKEELMRKHPEPRGGSPSRSCSDAEPTPPHELFLEEERIKTQLDASLYIGLRLNADLEAIRSDLELSQQICAAREREMRDLLEKVSSLEMEEGTGGEEELRNGTEDKTTTDTLEGKRVWVEKARCLSKAPSVNDDDSDTGLSSLHSQDSDGLPVWESLV
ncbi:ras association domain-containing protein 10 [Nothobranchius furzeri]|uniref:Ras association domain family member 10 n=2 Tax=Nothobranchius furzeri TaxID=105023 RepID=A0A8C6LFU3_NOTFU|nr:ras association domain-containing protein 10 [Nothobranchius furzeri]KAF7212003.1 ras association domain-containing protein 10-like [Nothobranchius furzeri]